MWEDSQNKRGGRWLITLAKQQRHTELDRFWLETVSAALLRLAGGVLVAVVPPPQCRALAGSVPSSPSPPGSCCV